MRFFYIILFIGICMVFNTCKEGAPGPAGKDGLSGMHKLNGTISGFAFLNDYLNNRLDDHRGIQITITDRNSVLQSTLTDKSGRFDLKDIKTGSYQIKYLKPGYATTVVSVVNFLGGNLPYYTKLVNLNQPSALTLNGISFDPVRASINNYNEAELVFFLGINADPQQILPIRVFYGTDRNVTKSDFVYSKIAFTNMHQNGYTVSDSIYLRANGFVNSDSICAIAYGTFFCTTQFLESNICDAQTQPDGSIEYVGLGKPSAVICVAKPR